MTWGKGHACAQRTKLRPSSFEWAGLSCVVWHMQIVKKHDKVCKCKSGATYLQVCLLPTPSQINA